MGTEGWLSGLLQNWMADLLKWAAIITAGTVFTWVKARDWRWATPLLYGFVAGVCLYIPLYGFSPQGATKSEVRRQVNNELRRLGVIPDREYTFRIDATGTPPQEMTITGTYEELEEPLRKMKTIFPDMVLTQIGMSRDRRKPALTKDPPDSPKPLK